MLLNRQDISFTINNIQRLNSKFVRVCLKTGSTLPAIEAGQFVQVRVQPSLNSWLRLPISIHDADVEKGEVVLLVQEVGEGSCWIASRKVGDSLQVLLPLGKGFPIKEIAPLPQRILLVGGGCGVAPLYYLVRCIRNTSDWGKTVPISLLIGAKKKEDLLLCQEFKSLGIELHICTEDASEGTAGLVTDSLIWKDFNFDVVYTCGPNPMMKAVAALVGSTKAKCYVSLENKMACGIGACLCCVSQDKNKHNVCVCTEGPVFEASVLGW